MEKGDGRRQVKGGGESGRVEVEEVTSHFVAISLYHSGSNMNLYCNTHTHTHTHTCTHTHTHNTHTHTHIHTHTRRALQSATISMYGEALYLRSFSELERSLLCSYGL